MGIGIMWHLRAGLIALLGLSTACGASRTTVASGPEPLSSEIPVQIDNQNYSDMNIYVVRNGQRLLLGLAGGLTKTTLTIRNAVRGDGRVRLLAEPIGGVRPIATPTLVVPQGQSIFWTIGSDPATSTASTG
jgi:hypothetical protein